MFRRGFHSSVKVAERAKVWSDFSQRSKSYAINHPLVKKNILEGSATLKDGPVTIGRRSNRLKYESPDNIDEAFSIGYKYLEDHAAKLYTKAQAEGVNKAEVERLLAKAELDNPEVQYNFQFHDKIENNPSIIDYSQPVYRHLGKKHWESYAQMLLMQRLESLAVIPDTMPTLIPRAEVNIKFPYSTGVNKWVEPGEYLSSNVTSLPPVVKIQEYELVDPTTQLYTILIVNPDEPDLKTDSFKTTLSYALVNIKVDYNDNVVDARKFSEENIIADYLPPVAEKNANTQRYAVWVFRQNNPIAKTVSNTIDRHNFNIRDFSKQNDLDAIGAQVWRSKWDLNVEKIRELYGLPKGRVFSRVRR
ncbi:Large ribosomal subunit protein mL38 [Nakaseomyces bracarensis]|uniref:Large ribosomal subunit protein mL38 n=1 Tax=Nakaseomyces bracarensis TaxID=273131 RepID=A0ABR4NYM3_9SACH